MNRRDMITGTATATVALATIPNTLADIENESDKYWEAQWLIGEYHQELEEMVTHAKIMKNIEDKILN
jgi:hypothetical protein